jgi:predicted permease
MSNRYHLVATDTRGLVVALAVSSSAAILFGLVPAWQSARSSRIDRLAARGQIGDAKQTLRSGLVVVQVAISLVLVTGAGLFVRTMTNVRDADLGFAPEQLLVAEVQPQAAGYQGARAVTLTRTLLDRLRALNGVTAVTMSEHGVLTGTSNGTNLLRAEGSLPGPEGFPQTRWEVVGPGYFTTSGIPLREGRDFTDRDNAASLPVVAINEQMARLFFAGATPVGRRLTWGTGAGAKTLEIVAVVRDVKQAGAREDPRPQFYLPYLQLPAIRSGWNLASTHFIVRTAAAPAAVAALVRREILSEDPRLSIAAVDVGADLVSRTIVRERMLAILLVAFGLLAVGLACLGLYGLVAFQVAQRTNEIGVRMALGARREDVLWLVIRRALVWTTCGVAIGVPLSLTASRIAQSLLFDLSPFDGVTLAAAVAVVVVMGLLAGYLPARRAARIDPLTALRVE